MTAFSDLPSGIREVLARGDRKGHALTYEQREHVAALLVETGIQGVGNLAWMANLIRHRLGVGDLPVAPGSLIAQGYAYELSERRAEDIARQVAAATKAAA